jgi:hypothetical protein
MPRLPLEANVRDEARRGEGGGQVRQDHQSDPQALRWTELGLCRPGEPSGWLALAVPPHLPRAQVTIAQKVVQGIYPGVTTSELDELAAETGEWQFKFPAPSV